MDKKDLKYSLVLDKYLDSCESLTESQKKELDEATEYFLRKANENMGISILNYCYVFTDENKNVREEYEKIQNVVNLYVKRHAEKMGKTAEDFSLEFINYGRTELVYVLTDNKTKEKLTILAKQPIVPFGKVKQEVDYLLDMAKFDSNVVAPIDYLSDGEQELYVTPYINQARCVASDNNDKEGWWGMYIPEPFYRFVPFNELQAEIVTSCMIAKLISYYDENKQEGIAACKLGGGDFMIQKGWEMLKPNYKNTLTNLYFIAAREKIKCSLKEYITLIKDEFARKTIDEDQRDLLLNHRGRVPISKDCIEKGIDLGLKLLKNKKNNCEEEKS